MNKERGEELKEKNLLEKKNIIFNVICIKIQYIHIYIIASS